MTAKIKLNAASGGGSFSLQAPSSSANNRVMTLPDSADGTLARTLDVAFKSYAYIVDRKAQNASSGTFTSGAWRTRDLNTKLYDPDSIVSISNNEFTLQAGSYLIKGSAPALNVDSHLAKLNNVTDGDDNIGIGTIAFVAANSNVSSRSFFNTRITITSAKAFSVLHRCTSTRSTNGFGITGNLDFETYTIVEIYKEV